MAAISGEIVERDGAEDDGEDGRPFEEFTLGNITVHFAEPSKGQMLIVIGMLDMVDEEDPKLQIEAVNHFGVVIKSLFTRDADRRTVFRSLANGSLELEEWFELAMAMIQQWAPEEITNREQRRSTTTKAQPQKRAARVVKGGRPR
jgi:hypothetical protein